MKLLRLLPVAVLALACGDDITRKVTSPLSASPAILEFGGVPVAEGRSQIVLLKNNGSVDLSVRELTLVESEVDAGKEFELNRIFERARCTDGVFLGPPKAPNVVEAGGCATITVTYVPLERAADNAVLNIQGDEEGQEPFLIPISGKGISPDVEICAVTPGTGDENCSKLDEPPLHIDFGIVPLDTEARRVLRIKNLGDAPLRIKEASIRNGDPAFSADPEFADGELAPGGVAALDLIFAPLLGGPRTAVYQVESDDPDEAAVPVYLEGRGDAPRLCFTQAPELAFGTVDAGSDKIMDAEIWNCGTQSFELRGLTISSALPFTLVSPPALPLVLSTDAGSDRLIVQVTFAPGAGGAADAILNARTDYQINAGGLLLTGNGKPVPACSISSAPASLNFGAAVASQGTVLRDLVVQNLGENPCTVSLPTVAGAMFRLAASGNPTFPLTLGPSRQNNIRVEFAPTSVGPHTGTLTVPTSDPLKPTVTVPLNGSATGTPICAIEIAPSGSTVTGASLAFGQVAIGRDKTLSVLVRNNGSASCTLYGARIVAQFGMSASDMTIVSQPPGSLAPGATTLVDVKFKPLGEVSYPAAPLAMASIQINTSDPAADQAHQCTMISPYTSNAGCRQVGLSGDGVRSPISVVPGELAFGVITLGCPVSKKIVTIYNLGTASVTINAVTVTPVGGPFTKVSGPPTPFTLAGGTNVKVTVGYTPASAQPEVGTLTIDHSLGTTTVPLSGGGTNDANQLDRFTQVARPMVDVLFIVDDSGSMSEEQSALSSNGERFMQTALSLNTDFHVGVTTTDVDSAHTGCGGGGFFGGLSSCGWPNLTIEPGVLWGTPKIIQNSTPDPVGIFKKSVNPGTNGSGDEQGLRAVEMALSDPLINDPTKNGGFLREDAKLSVVIVSDEEDGSDGSIDYYVDFLRAIKGYRNASMLSYAAIVGPPGGCNSSNGNAVHGQRYIEVGNRLGGLFRSICSSDWGRIAEDLGLDAFGARSEFFLSRQADPSTIRVTVNGTSSPAGNWSYDPTANSIIFAPAFIPGPGAVIEVRYGATCPP